MVSYIYGTPTLEKVVDEEFNKRRDLYQAASLSYPMGSEGRKYYEDRLWTLFCMEVPRYMMKADKVELMTKYQVWWMKICKFFNCNWYNK